MQSSSIVKAMDATNIWQNPYIMKDFIYRDL
jgi:hypothetical protein